MASQKEHLGRSGQAKPGGRDDRKRGWNKSVHHVSTEAAGRPTAILLGDVMFGARINGALARMGWAARMAGTPEAAWTALLEGRPRLLMIELGAGNAARSEFLRSLRSTEEYRDLPILAFGSHKARSVLEEARRDGATLVVSNGLLVSRFPELIERALAAGPGAEERLLTEDESAAD